MGRRLGEGEPQSLIDYICNPFRHSELDNGRLDL